MPVLNELTVRRFFEGEVSPRELQTEALGSLETRQDGSGARFTRHRIVDMTEDFAVTPTHVVALLDAVTAGNLNLEALNGIVFCVEASDRFFWDGDEEYGKRVASALFWLGAPEINYPLTEDVLKKIRHYLLTGENRLTKGDTKRQDAK